MKNQHALGLKGKIWPMRGSPISTYMYVPWYVVGVF